MRTTNSRRTRLYKASVKKVSFHFGLQHAFYLLPSICVSSFPQCLIIGLVWFKLALNCQITKNSS